MAGRDERVCVRAMTDVPKVQWALRKRNISYKFEFLRRQYQAESLNFLIGTLFARGTVFAIARATW